MDGADYITCLPGAVGKYIYNDSARKPGHVYVKATITEQSRVTAASLR